MASDLAKNFRELPVKVMANAAIIVYSVLITVLWPLVFALSRLSPKAYKQLEGRQNLLTLAPVLTSARNRKSDGCLFFCSSAGEFEQAKPLIDRFLSQDVFVHTVFFSRSGLEFAKARGETSSYSLAPPDSVWNWGWLFSALRPSRVFVMRHELWPAFLVTAKFWGKLYLVDASVQAARPSQFRIAIKSRLLKKFDHIFAVADQDRKRLTDDFGLHPDKISVVGDTKYDRVFERIQRKLSGDGDLIMQIRHLAGRRRILIVGSAHQPDVSLVARAYRLLPTEVQGNWFVVFVPHHVDQDHIEKFTRAAAELGMPCNIYSQLPAVPSASIEHGLFFDVMGKLAELYSTADAVVVGGAWHHQVHNVLEPACHGMPLVYGPRYETSHEARALVEKGIAEVAADERQLARWWQQSSLVEENRLERKQKVAAWCGATDKIFEFMGSYDGQTINS